MKIKLGLLLAAFLVAAFALLPARAKDAAEKPAPKIEKPDPLLTLSVIGTAVVKNQNVNVRGQASFLGEVITKLKKGETVTLLEEIKLQKPKKDEPTNWFRILLPANTPVWVHSDFIDPTNQTIRPKKLNVRAGPGENFSVIARMIKGGRVKQIRKVNDWIEIEAPTNAFAFVAAEFLEKQEIAPTAPPPTELAETSGPAVVTTSPAEEIKPAVDVPTEAKPEEPVASAPIVPDVEPVAEPAADGLSKRVVIREGNVRATRNIQAPTYYQLENLDGELINYLHSPEVEFEDPETKKMLSAPKFNLKNFVGQTVRVTGEEAIDRRWKKTPVLEIQALEEEK